MSKLERVTVEVPEFVAEKIEAAIESGEFEAPEEAVGQALMEWAWNRLAPDQIEYLKQVVAEAKASGSRSFDMDSIIREAKAEKRARERKVG
jgi:Arc/MetJ-type ribon-helix-helix transcriptional regulator